MKLSLILTLFIWLLVLSGQVHAAAVCSDTPTAADRIECIEDSDSTTAILIDARGITITTTDETGVTARHAGTGRIQIDVSESTINTTGRNAVGIHGSHQDSPGSGEIRINSINTDITTTGAHGWGIEAAKKGATSDGNIVVEMNGGSIMTEGSNATGIFTYADHEAGDSTISVTVKGGARIETNHPLVDMNAQNPGVHAVNNKSGSGNVIITLENATIETDGDGLKAERYFGPGNIIITATDSTITTKGVLAHAIRVRHEGMGDIIIRATGVDIKTTATGFSPTYRPMEITFSQGIQAWSNRTGDIIVDVRGGSIDTAGNYSFGIYVNKHENDGNIMVTTAQGNTLTTMGENAHGIVTYHSGSLDTNRMDVTVGGTITTTGDGAQGVRVGSLTDEGITRLVAPIGTDGYRNQTVTVNGSITSTEEGVFLAGGGKVFIGPMGMIRSESGVAILAIGDTPGANDGDPPIKPKLLVDMNLDGRKVVEVIGDNWIINDGGETTIAVNDIVLHEGDTGVTGLTAPNGAWNVTMREEGVTVNRDDPASWVISEPAVNVVVDRDFSTQDFTEARRPQPVPAPDPETDTDTDTEMPVFMEEYAPRAALYESLPGFLLRMADRGRLNHRPVSPVWMVFSGGNGSVDPSRSTTGAEYDYDRSMVQFGMNLIFGEGLEGWFAIHYTQGDSEVSSPTGGGDMDAEGAGAAFNIQWQHASGYYVDGRTSFTAYDVDLSSDDVGRLRSSVDALGVSFNLETGLRLAMGESLHLTPRAWLSHSSIDIDSFTDAVDAKASFPDEVRLTGGFGALAETMQPWKGGELTWHGSLDIEQMLNSRSTRVDVSGEQLKTETVSTRLLLGLGSHYQKGDFSISAQISADGLATNDEEYSGQVNIGVRL